MKRHGIRRMAASFILLASPVAAFADVAYIESTGDQAISLGRKMTSATRWEVDFALTDAETLQQRVFGVSSGSGQLALYVNGEGKWSFGAKAGGYATPLAADTARHVAIGDATAGKGYIVTGAATNGVSAATFSVEGESGYPLAVFGYAANTGGTEFGNFAKVRVYAFRVWESGKLVMEGIPALKGGIPGFYDRVGGRFHRSRTGSPLAYGGDIGTIVETDPYIRADGRQFIDTGYAAKTTSCFELDYEIEPDNAAWDAGGSVQTRLLTADESSAVATIYVAGTAGGTDANIAFACGDTWSSAWTGQGFDALRRTAVLDIANARGRLLEDGVEISSKALSTMTSDATKSLSLFALIKTDGKSAQNQARMKLYSFRILESGKLVHDYRPAVRVGVAGLLDAVGGGFLAPAPTGRPFSYGGEGIDSDGSDGAHLSSTGDQIVNTSRSIGLKTRVEVDFALNNHTNCQERIFGATKATDFVYGLYCNGTVAGAGDFSIAAGDYEAGKFPGYDTGVPVDLKRHTAIIDVKNRMMYFITGSTTNYSHEIANATKGSSWLMGLFGEPYTADFSGTDHRADMRLYSCKVYDDDVLKQHWLPCGSGLVNVITGDVRRDGRAAAVPFTPGGRGWGEPPEDFHSSPTNISVRSGKSAGLSAFAPAALSYQWYVDGEPAAGATNSTFEVSWFRSRKTVPVSVKAMFSLGDMLLWGKAEADVTMAPAGMCVVFK